MDEQFMKLPDQIESMKNWPLVPDYIINIRMPDEDLIIRRQGEKIDPTTGLLYIKEQYAPTPVDKAVSSDSTCLSLMKVNISISFFFQSGKKKAEDDENSEDEGGDDDEEDQDEAEEEEDAVVSSIRQEDH